MKMMIMAILLAASFGVQATNNNPPNECGNHGNNCQPNGGNNEANSHADGGNGYGGDATAVGVGVGVGLGGQGGAGGSGGSGGSGGDGGNAFGGSAVGVGGDGGSVMGSGNSANLNSNTAKGGSAYQQQGQGQSQSSTSGAVSGSKSIAQMASENSNRNDNQSSANGNTTVNNVGGDSTLVERNAPPVFLGNLSATMSCSGGFNAGASDRNGSGAFGFTWISGDCRSVVIGREFVGIGMPDVACRVWKTTKGYKRAVKADPSLADVDCTIKPEPAAVVVPTPVLVAPELAPRVPRG